MSRRQGIWDYMKTVIVGTTAGLDELTDFMNFIMK